MHTFSISRCLQVDRTILHFIIRPNPSTSKEYTTFMCSLWPRMNMKKWRMQSMSLPSYNNVTLRFCSSVQYVLHGINLEFINCVFQFVAPRGIVDRYPYLEGTIPIFRRAHLLHTQSQLELIQDIRLSQSWRPKFKFSSPWKKFMYQRFHCLFALFLLQIFHDFSFPSRRFSPISPRNINILYSNNNLNSNCIPPWKIKQGSFFLSFLFFDIRSYNVTLVQKCERTFT